MSVKLSKLDSDVLREIATHLPIRSVSALGETNKDFNALSKEHINKWAIRKVPTFSELDRPEIKDVRFTVKDDIERLVLNKSLFHRTAFGFIQPNNAAHIKLQSPLIRIGRSTQERFEFTDMNKYYVDWEDTLSELFQIMISYKMFRNITRRIKVRNHEFVMNYQSIDDKITLKVVDKSTKTIFKYILDTDKLAESVIVRITGKNATYELKHIVDIENPENIGEHIVYSYKTTNHFSCKTMGRIDVGMLFNILILIIRPQDDSSSSSSRSTDTIEIGNEIGEMHEITYKALHSIIKATQLPQLPQP